MNWHYRHTVLILCTVAFFVTMAARVVVSPLVPALTGDFRVTNTSIGIALTGMWIAYSLAQFPSGVLADRFGERPVMLASVGGTSLLLLVIALTPQFGLFIAALVLLGAFAGLHYSVATTLLTRTYDDIGTAIGIHNVGAPAAGVLVPVLAVWIETRIGWRPAIGFVGVVGLPVAVLFAWRVRPTQPRRPDERMRQRLQLESIFELLSRPSIAFTVFISVAATFVWQGIASFLPTFLVEHRGLSVSLAGFFFSLYFVVQGVVQVVVGTVSDWLGRDGALMGCMVAGSLGVAMLITVPGALAIGISIALVGVGMSFAAATIPRFMDNLSQEERGAGIGLVRSVYGIFGALGSVIVGFLADGFSWPVSFGVLILLMVLVLTALIVNHLVSLDW